MTTGGRYRALVALEYPTDTATIRRIRAGEDIPPSQRRGVREVNAGEVIDDVPAVSVPWLLEQGLIEAVEEVMYG